MRTEEHRLVNRADALGRMGVICNRRVGSDTDGQSEGISQMAQAASANRQPCQEPHRAAVRQPVQVVVDPARWVRQARSAGWVRPAPLDHPERRRRANHCCRRKGNSGSIERPYRPPLHSPAVAGVCSRGQGGLFLSNLPSAEAPAPLRHHIRSSGTWYAAYGSSASGSSVRVLSCTTRCGSRS